MKEKTKLSSLALFKKQIRASQSQEFVEEEPKKKKKPLFSLLDHMCGDKCSWEQLSDDERGAMNQWLFLRWLSTYEEYLPIFNIISQLELRDKDFYELMCCTLKKRRHYFTSKIYKKFEEPDEELLRCIMHEYFYTVEKARDYMEDLDPAEAERIRSRWKDIVEVEVEEEKKKNK